MSDPKNYDVSYSFSGFQASAPSSPLPAPKLDIELQNIAEAVAAIVVAIKDVRRSDGALRNGSVSFDQLAPSLQLTFDPTNGQLVAAAVSVAQAAAADATVHDNSAALSAGSAASSAAAAIAAAGSVNLSLYLPKAGNLAGLGNNDNALANIGAAKNDSTNVTGRLSPQTGQLVGDWNTVLASGWFSGFSAANGPAAGDWLVEVIAFSNLYVQQIAYPFTNAATSVSSVTPMRRYGYNNAGALAWQPWESFAPVQIGSTIWVNATSAPPGYVKENGALLLRASYPALYAFAAASGNIVSEATWTAGSTGAFSTGDLATSFRIPDARGEFIRGYDDGRGIDSGRVLGAHQADMLKDHAHQWGSSASVNSGGGAAFSYALGGTTLSNTSGVNTPNNGGTETRPRNNAKLACIKY